MLAKCAKCGKDINYFNDLRSAWGQPHCNSCYFDELGEMMEKHPPGFHPQYIEQQKTTPKKEPEKPFNRFSEIDMV